MPEKQCRCGSGARLDACCGPYLAGLPAPTAEALMRSRYTAFTLGDGAYIARTFAAEHRDSANTDLPDVIWVGLKINGTSGGGPADTTGTVDFSARFRDGGETRIHGETPASGAKTGYGSMSMAISRRQRCRCRWAKPGETMHAPAGRAKSSSAAAGAEPRSAYCVSITRPICHEHSLWTG